MLTSDNQCHSAYNIQYSECEIVMIITYQIGYIKWGRLHINYIALAIDPFLGQVVARTSSGQGRGCGQGKGL